MKLWKVTGARDGELFDVFVSAEDDSYDAVRVAIFDHGLTVINVEESPSTDQPA